MAERQYMVNGECLVKVKGGGALAQADGEGGEELWELGLSIDEIRIIPRFFHYDIKTDDFGPDVPVNIIWNLADVTIMMTLVHFDDDILDRCISNSMGNGVLGSDGNPNPGKLVAAGTILGGKDNSDTKFISLNLLSPQFEKPWVFTYSYLTAQPLEIPLGTSRSLVQLTWRAIPFPQAGNEVESAGATLWSYELDTE